MGYAANAEIFTHFHAFARPVYPYGTSLAVYNCNYFVMEDRHVF